MKNASRTNAIVRLLLLMMLVVAGCHDVEKELPTPAGVGESVDVLVKFSEGSDIRLRDGELVSLSRGEIPELTGLFEEFQVVSLQRAFSQSEEEIEADRQQLIEEGQTHVPDLNLHYILTVADEDTALRLIEKLSQLAVVQSAERMPQPAPPPAQSP